MPNAQYVQSLATEIKFPHLEDSHMVNFLENVFGWNFGCEAVERLQSTQDSWAIAKMTARCALYMGALKNFGESLTRRLLFPKFLMDLGGP